MKLSCLFLILMLPVLSLCPIALADAQSTADELFSYVDLDAPELSGVKTYYQSGQYSEALDAYRDLFLENIEGLSFSGLPSCSSNADDLLNNNVVRIYNLAGGYESQDIGAPGSIDWYQVTSFEHWTYYLSNMHWTSSLIEKFAQSPGSNGAYLGKWVEYWYDFSQNNYSQWSAIEGTAAEADYGGLFRNIWLHHLVLGDRVRYLLSQLSQAVQSDLAVSKTLIDGEKLGAILSEMAQRNMPRLNSSVHGGVPNQVLYSSLGLLQSSFGFLAFHDAGPWHATGEYEIQNYLTMSYMADGTDMEQSFNYNGTLINAGMEVQDLYTSSGQALPAWMSDYEQAMLYRFRMLASVVRPNGMLPSLDLQSDADAYARLTDYQGYFGDPLVGQIIDHTWSVSPSEPVPAFDSIYFPYGGYAIVRDGWGSNANHLFMKNSRMGKGHYDNSANQVQITAFGKTVLIDSGGSLYVPDYRNDYFHNSFGHNTILVDGKSQCMCGEHSPAYTTPIENRYLTGAHFDFVEGSYGNGVNGGYGNNVIDISDVTHKREVTFVRETGVYVIVDRLLSPSSHTYTQVWNYNKDYAKEEVTLAGVDKILTVKSFQPNVAIYNYSEHAPLSYTRYYGYYNGVDVFGWAKDGSGYTQAVDTHRSWTGTGNQLLVTLIAPMNWDNEPVTVTNSIATSEVVGFDAVGVSGETVGFVARKTAGTIAIGDITVQAKSLLVREKDGILRGVVLGCTSFSYLGNPLGGLTEDFEFEIQGGMVTVVSDVAVPSMFTWAEDGTNTQPVFFQTVDIEVEVSPGYVTTVSPQPGMYTLNVNAELPLAAEDFVQCPYVDTFSHWEVDGQYYSGQAQTVLTATDNAVVTAVLVDDRQCGDECHPIPRSDLTGDCRVDIADLSILAEAWLIE